MNGTSHKAIGFATGAAIVTYAVLVNQPLMAFGIVTAPMGAMLPDIDHHNTKLGRTKEKVFQVIKRTAMVAAVLSVVLAGISIFIPFMSSMIPLFIIAGVVGVFIITALSKTLAEKIPFLSKHRGIMHTLLLPGIMLALCLSASNVVVKALVFGFAAGYISHLYADSLTVAGCPLAWPVSTECVGLKLIKTGTVWEYVCVAVFSAAVLGYAVLLAGNPDYLILAFVVIIIPTCDAFTRKLCRLCIRSKKAVLVRRIGIGLLMLVLLAMCIFCDGGVKILAGSAITGVIMGILYVQKDK